MSFGFGVGDFLATIQAANKIRKEFSAAPSQFQGIAADVRNLAIILQDVDTCLAVDDLTDAQQASFRELDTSCRQVLNDIEKCLSKYSSLEFKQTGLRYQLRRVWQRVKLEPDEIRDYRSRITSSTNLLNIFLGNQTRGQIATLVENNDQLEFQKLLAWLVPADFAAHQLSVFDQRLLNTGKWLLKTAEYCNWLDTSQNTLLLSGIPGAGKTIVMSIVIDELQRTQLTDPGIGLWFFYFDFSRRQPLDRVLKSFLRQTYEQSRSVSQNVKDLYEQSKLSHTKLKLEDVRVALHAAASHFRRLFIIVDALDECEESNGDRQKIIMELRSLQDSLHANILITSRPHLLAKDAFDHCMSLDFRASDEDISIYISEHIQYLPRFVVADIILQNDIKKTISEAVDGMFLLAKFHLEFLQGKKSARAIREALNDLATGAHAYTKAYAKTMERVCAQIQDRRDIAIQTLMWIVFGKTTMSMNELLHALALEKGDKNLHQDNIPDQYDVISACCGLVSLDPDNIVRLVHKTAEEYFQGSGSTWMIGAHTYLANTCLSYLSLGNFSEEHNDPGSSKHNAVSLVSSSCNTSEFRTISTRNDWLKQTSFPFYEYATLYWPYHVSLQNDVEVLCEFLSSRQNVKASIKFLVDVMLQWEGDSKTLLRQHPLIKSQLLSDEAQDNGSGTQLRMGNGSTTSSKRCIYQSMPTEGATPVHILAWSGWKECLQNLPYRWDIDALDINRRTAISYAAERNSKDIVQILIDAGATVNQLDMSSYTPLIYAAIHGHEDIVRILIEAGANVHQSDRSRRTPLIHAASHGYGDIVIILLAARAKIEHQDSRGLTAIYYAYLQGHQSVAKILKAAGGHRTSPSAFDGRDLLSVCVAEGNVLAVETLLAEGAAADVTDSSGRGLIHHAIRGRPNQHIIHLLLTHGAQPDLSDIDGRTPLSLAAEHGCFKIASELLDAGVDVEHSDNRKRTPLAYAVLKEHEQLVRFLLEKDADINSRDEAGQTALHHASKKRNKSLITLLLDDHRTDPNLADHYHATPIDYVVWPSQVNLVRIFLEDKRVRLVSHGVHDVFHAAVAGGDLSLLCLLLDHEIEKLGLETGSRSVILSNSYRVLEASGGRSLLRTAVHYRNKAMFSLLLNEGADIESAERDGLEPFQYCACAGVEWIKQLLDTAYVRAQEVSCIDIDATQPEMNERERKFSLWCRALELHAEYSDSTRWSA